MNLPSNLSWLRSTHIWRRAQDWRRLRRERAAREFFRPMIPDGGLVFDVGANVGHKSLLFHSLGARVVAMEPQSALVGELRRRFEGQKSIKVVHCAVGSSAGTLTLQKCTAEPAIASLRADFIERSRFQSTHQFDASETVPVRTLDDLCKEFGKPDFCKIDVEGFEVLVIGGLSSRVGVISFEFNREFLDDAKACVVRLSALGYTDFNACLGEVPAWISSRALKGDELLHRLASDPNSLLWGDIYALA
jgi:FkbM family methyltransferase